MEKLSVRVTQRSGVHRELTLKIADRMSKPQFLSATT